LRDLAAVHLSSAVSEVNLFEGKALQKTVFYYNVIFNKINLVSKFYDCLHL